MWTLTVEGKTDKSRQRQRDCWDAAAPCGRWKWLCQEQVGDMDIDVLEKSFQVFWRFRGGSIRKACEGIEYPWKEVVLENLGGHKMRLVEEIPVWLHYRVGGKDAVARVSWELF